MLSKGRNESKDDGGFRGSAFAQQRISAWQPVLAPRWMIGALILLGTAAATLGIVLIITSNGVTECMKLYHDPPSNCLGPCSTTVTIDIEDCQGPLTDVEDGAKAIMGPTYLYYSLTNFYQNHRRYLLSRNNAQLQGEVVIDSAALKDCEPALFSDDGVYLLSPCGLAARSVFNDTLIPMRPDEKGSYTMREGVADIIWPQNMVEQFKNPVVTAENVASVNRLKQWLDNEIFPGQVENAHFMVWMRNAALPNFRKLYGILPEPIRIPLNISVNNRYPVSSFGGKKFLILSTTSWLGGRNPFLGVIFITLGSLLCIIGLFMAIKNRKAPRILGDVRFLRWTKGKQN